jgi:RND superfamily putative drug exporter
VALSAAVLFDAFLIRLIIVPSLMYQFGKANWWLPRRLGRVLPQVAVESEDDVAYEESEFDDIPEDGEMPAVAGKMAG